ncbi:MAG: hypothetical protein ABSC72_06330 [Methylovirgula sp.]
MSNLPSILVAAAIALAGSAAAEAGTIKDCEKIQAADAYNQCLASFGPVAHQHELKPVPSGIGMGRLYGMRHRHHGGKSLELSVAPQGGGEQD